jgi:hypothetical protein
LNASRICEDVSSRKRREVGNANMLLCEFIDVSFSYKLKMFWCYGKIKRSKGQLPVAVHM